MLGICALTASRSPHYTGLLLAMLLAVSLVPAAFAQISPEPSQRLITQPIDERNLVVLAGNTRPEARNPANDRGIVPAGLPLPHMMLQLRRPPAQELAVKALIDQLHDRNSPNFHHWLGASELGARFGPAASDIQIITGWLRQRGFIVNLVYPNGMVIDFSGTAGQIRAAFRTEIHNLSVDGVAHIANMTDPQLPAALAPAVAGIVSLSDFEPKPRAVIRPPATVTDYYVTPSDLATIYNFNPLFKAGKTGQGQTIYIVESSDFYTGDDWTTFRSGFGIPLSNYPDASLSTLHPLPPSGPDNCTDPGVASAAGEAIIDAEYSSAAAPSAAIVNASCAKVGTTFGQIVAIENLLNGSNPPAIISMSYADCEAELGQTANEALSSAYQTGVIAGTSIFVAAGDSEAGQCSDKKLAIFGISVNGYASTPYNVAVGGTDFADTYLGENSIYWKSTNSSTYGSAKSYVPEIPWNNSCGSRLTASYNGYATTYGSAGFCNSAAATAGAYLTDSGGSGGPSGCATGAPSVPNVVSGTCAGYAKPSWQGGLVGNPNDGVRDLPDVSMFAADAPWRHSYIICFSDTAMDGLPCVGPPTSWSRGYGGTSFASPIWAGIQALVNQSAGGKQGLPNYRLYQLAAAEYGANGSSACDSSKGRKAASSCIFYDVTLGDNDAPCQSDKGTYYNCYDPSGTYGVLSTSNSSYAPAYKATTGWDFATGIGTVNVHNLVLNWNKDFEITVVASPAADGTVSGGGKFAKGCPCTVTATPKNGSSFVDWTENGKSVSTSEKYQFTLKANVTLVAHFKK